MKKLLFTAVLAIISIALKSQQLEKVVYSSDSLQFTADKYTEKKPCKITFTYQSGILTIVTVRYNNKKTDDWAFTNLEKTNMFWNCEEYIGETSNMGDMLIGVCGEGKDLKRKSFIICSPQGAKTNDCFKYLNIKEVKTK